MLPHAEQPLQLMAQNPPTELKLNSLWTQLQLQQVHLKKMALQIRPHVPQQLVYLSENYSHGAQLSINCAIQNKFKEY